jgi:hypothetical protein
MTRRLRAAVLLTGVPLALLACACGGDLKADELRRGVESLGSIAAEGALLADGAAQDRTKATFTRVQARTLGDQAVHEAEKLGDASATRPLRTAKRDATRLAGDIAERLGRLQIAPSDRGAARGVAGSLRRAATRADELAAGL